MFIDRAVIEVRSGKGGDGAIAFLHEKYVAKGNTVNMQKMLSSMSQ